MPLIHVRARIIETHDLAIIANGNDPVGSAFLKVETMTPAQIRAASRSMKVKTSVTFAKPMASKR